ncbi:MAG: hypothetical protein J3Q66DRAFT_387508 [Benniella sp.]|nr:MAG: hypothetical protein J3Q66DRAFT_387508 [Benniella sp.]
MVLRGGLEIACILFVPSIQLSLSTASHTDHHHLGTNSNLKIEALGFLCNLIRTHSSEVSQRHHGQRCYPVIVFGVLHGTYHPHMDFDDGAPKYSSTSLSPEVEQCVLQSYNVILQRVSAADADQEVKEHSILCLGVLLSRCHVLAMSSTGIDDVPAAVAREASE